MGIGLVATGREDHCICAAFEEIVVNIIPFIHSFENLQSTGIAMLNAKDHPLPGQQIFIRIKDVRSGTVSFIFHDFG